MSPFAPILKPGARLGEEVVLLKVGPRGTRFMIHKQLICASAPFFEKAFQPGAFKEGIEGTLHLPEDHPGALGIFIEWIYLAKIPNGHSQSYVDALYYLWFFIQKLCMPTMTLKDTVMDKIQDIANIYSLEPNPAMMKLVFAQTPVDSALRLYCVEVIAHSVLVKSVIKRADEENQDFEAAERWRQALDKEVNLVYEMVNGHQDIFRCLFYEAIGYANTSSLSDPRARYREGTQHMETRCRYHEHGAGVVCHLFDEKQPAFIRDV
ncbi:hypothetical protein WAI453_007121 [Rhynchosporium graminicola]|uniref:BTB domain-containing protein n=1 Tax=Rhynchosporium graminicola TaxID=2792576 RepID=A0A1E1LHE3_9HELO|nr:uncharacterized protein RCO7_02254 [Rhynchosporium commune]